MTTNPLEKLCPSFQPEEILSPIGLFLLKQGQLMMQPSFLKKLQDFRQFINYPLLANHAGLTLRGYRSPSENESIKDGKGNQRSAEFSRHVQGIAIDITCPDLSLPKLRDLALDYGWPAVLYYPKLNFVHVDDRGLTGDRKQIYREY